MVLTGSPTWKPLDVGSNCGHRSRCLVTQTGGQLGIFQILAAAEHRFGTVEPDRFDRDLHLALTGRRDFHLLDPQNFRAADLVESHDFGHDRFLLK